MNMTCNVEFKKECAARHLKERKRNDNDTILIKCRSRSSIETGGSFERYYLGTPLSQVYEFVKSEESTANDSFW